MHTHRAAAVPIAPSVRPRFRAPPPAEGHAQPATPFPPRPTPLLSCPPDPWQRASFPSCARGRRGRCSTPLAGRRSVVSRQYRRPPCTRPPSQPTAFTAFVSDGAHSREVWERGREETGWGMANSVSRDCFFARIPQVWLTGAPARPTTSRRGGRLLNAPRRTNKGRQRGTCARRRVARRLHAAVRPSRARAHTLPARSPAIFRLQACSSSAPEAPSRRHPRPARGTTICRLGAKQAPTMQSTRPSRGLLLVLKGTRETATKQGRGATNAEEQPTRPRLSTPAAAHQRARQSVARTSQTPLAGRRSVVSPYNRRPMGGPWSAAGARRGRRA